MKYLWIVMSGYCELLSTVFFVPVCGILARAGDCTYDRGFGSDIGSGSGSSTDGGGLMWLDAMRRELDELIALKCWDIVDVPKGIEHCCLLLHKLVKPVAFDIAKGVAWVLLPILTLCSNSCLETKPLVRTTNTISTC